MSSAESVRSPPSPQQTRRVSPVYQAGDLSQEMQSIMEEKTLEVRDRERLQSLSPEPESECVSLEPEVGRDLMMSPVESGRRSTQGIPEVGSHPLT